MLPRFNASEHMRLDAINFILENNSYREKLKEYAIRSFCGENVLFYEDVHKFKKIKDQEEMDAEAVVIYNKYIVSGAPYELNIQTDMSGPIANIIHSIQSSTFSNANEKMFDKLERHCISDIRDVYSRFKYTNEGLQIEKEILREETELEIMSSSGMIDTRDGEEVSRGLFGWQRMHNTFTQPLI
jgi:hypothetical protein